jgi:hypothetical protein
MLHMLHMDYIQITYELHTGYIWKLISTVHTYAACNLHTDYIWKHSCIYPAYIQYMSLKKINKSIMNQWSHFWESPYFIANCRFGRGLASQGRSKPPRKMGDASNAATNQEATGNNPQYSLSSNNLTCSLGPVVAACAWNTTSLQHQRNEALRRSTYTQPVWEDKCCPRVRGRSRSPDQ